MIGIDTNVLIRYIVQDDPEQSRIATRFIEEDLSPEGAKAVLPAIERGASLCCEDYP